MRRVSVGVPTALLALLCAGCGGVGAGEMPDRLPEVSGSVERDGADVRLVRPSDTYYEGMSLLDDDAVVVRASDGAVVDETALEDGVSVDVWIADGCAESYPVQCDIELIRVLDATAP